MRRPLALLFLAAGLAAAAESTASGALFALAVGLALLIAGVGLAVVLAASRVRVTRTVLEREVVEGRPVRLRFQVAGIEWLPVTLEAEDGSGAWFELGRAGGLIEVTVGRRGAYRLLASRLRIRDSAGIFEWQLRAGAVEPLLILPSSSAPANLPPPHSLAGDPELDGLEDHVLGAPLARIHWPALARGAGLQVRRFSVASGALPLVVVDTSGARDVRAVDWAVRTAAGHILALTRRGGCRVLLPGDAAATAVLELDGGWRALLRRLAMVDPAGPAPRLADEGPTLRIRASAAPARLVRAVPPALPRGVVPVVSEAPAL